MPTSANALVLMAKAPIAGSVKTRLTPLLSAAQAAALARALLVDQLEHLCAFRNADLYLAFAPVGARQLIRHLTPSRAEIFPQRGLGLGARMQNIFATLFANGHNRIVLIGGDLLPVPLQYFTKAFTYLDARKSLFDRRLANGVLSGVKGAKTGGFDGSQQRAVLGPSRDGGFYLIGLNEPVPRLFNQMTWSHDRVFAETAKRLAQLSISTLKLPQWSDIDRPDDLKSVQALLNSSLKQTAPNVSRVLSEIKSTSKPT